MEDEQEFRQHEDSLAKGTAYGIIARSAFLVSGFAIQIGLGRYLGKSMYGVFGTVLALVTINRMFLNNGIPTAITKYIAQSSLAQAARIQRLGLMMQMGMAGLIFVIYFAGAPLLAGILHDQGLVYYIRVSSLVVPAMALYSIYLGTLNGLKRFVRQAWAVTGYSVARVVAVFGLAALFGVSGALLGHVVAGLVAWAIAAWGLGLGRGRGRQPQLAEGEERVTSRMIVLFAVPVLAFNVATSTLGYIDLLSVKSLLGSNAETGLYTAASALAWTPYYVIFAFSATLLPTLSRTISLQDHEGTRKYISGSLRYVLLIMLGGGVVTAGAANGIMVLAYGQQYAAAGPVLGLLIFGFVFLTLFIILTTMQMAAGKPGLPMALALVLLPTDLLFCVLLIPRFGLMGAAAATTLTAVIGMLVSGALVYMEFHHLMEWKSALRIAAAGLVTFVVGLLVRTGGVMVVAEFAGLFALYFGLLAAMRELQPGDLARLQEVFVRKRSA